MVRPRPEAGRPARGGIRRTGRVGAVEALEDVADVVGRDARTLVGDADLEVIGVAAVATTRTTPPAGLWPMALATTLRIARPR